MQRPNTNMLSSLMGSKSTSNSGKGIFNGNTNVQIGLIVLSMLVIVFVTIYIVKLFKQNNLKQVALTDKIINLNDTSEIPYKVESTKLSVTSKGQEFSYSFWLYLSDNYSVTTSHKLIFERGNIFDNTQVTNPVYQNCNPIVALHGSTNKLMVAVSTDKVNQALSINNVFDSNNNYLISVVDYMPLQRWVNIGIVIRDNMLMVFLDGDIYSITTTSDIPNAGGSRPIITSSSGSVTIGERNIRAVGFLSKFQYFNYGLTQKELARIYKRGPVTKSFLSFFGIGNYGMRSPIYQIDEDVRK